MSEFSDAVNQHAAKAAGMDLEEMHRVEQLLEGNARAFLQDFITYMADTHSMSPASSMSTILQVALHGMIFAAPGAPVTDWMRTLCDTLDRELEGKPPLPAQQARIQKLTLAVMQATKDRANRGRVQ